jgi:hypothetical protein
MTDDVVNPVPGLGQAQKGGGVKSVNGTPPTLDLNSDDNKINNNLSLLNVHKNIQGVKQTQENFEDTKRIIISRKSKDRQYNGQKKKGQTNTSIPEIYKYSNTSTKNVYLKFTNIQIPVQKMYT